MKTLMKLDWECRRLLKMSLKDIESARGLHLAGLVPVVDIDKLDSKLSQRHAELSEDGVSLADVVLAHYGQEAVDWIERHVLQTEK